MASIDGRGGFSSKTQPEHPGNCAIDFAELVRLESIDEVTFRSVALPYAPGGSVGNGSAYGGHVFAQAAWAAAQTVGDGFVLHCVSGNFILPGLLNVPWVYSVQTVRDGRSYCTRTVNVTQASDKDTCFISTCSFKKSEVNLLDEQQNVELWKRYDDGMLKTKMPDQLEDVHGMDVPWYCERRRRTGENDVFPGLDMRRTDMTSDNDNRHPLDRREVQLYRPRGELGTNPNLHIVAHLYASDRNSIFAITQHLDLGHYWTQMTSLMHTVVFHGPVEDLLFGPSKQIRSRLDDGTSRWFAKEDWGSRVASGRILFNSRVSNSSGRQISTAIQDGLLRFGAKKQPTDDELRTIEEVRQRWPEKPKL